MISDHVLKEANRWFIELRDCGAQTAVRKRFEKWLLADSTHRLAYARAEQNWRALDRLTRFLGPITYATSDDLMRALRGESEEMERRRLARERRTRLIAGAAVTCAMVGIAAVWLMRPLTETRRLPWTPYETTNQSIPLKLQDGSLLYLQRNTHLRVRFTQSTREVFLDSGEAFFRVRHEPRAFVVMADRAVVRATGTEFLLAYHLNGQVDAAVKEGRVQVSSPECDCEEKQLPLEAGQSAVVTAHAVRVGGESAAQVARKFAWTGVIHLDGTIAEAAAKFNWHNEQQLVIADADVAGLKVGGIYNWSLPEEFAASLQERGVDYQVIESSDPTKVRILLRKRR